MRVLAADYGDRRTGIAISDAMGVLTGRAFTIKQRDENLVAQAIIEEAENEGVRTIVIGYPKNMDGTVGPRAEKCEGLKRLIEENCDIPVVLWDERRTTVDAHRILRENGKKTKNHRDTVDAVAAGLILESYLMTL